MGARKATALRVATLRCVALRAHRLYQIMFHTWRRIAEAIACIKMRCMLQADDLRNRYRRRLRASVLTEWRERIKQQCRAVQHALLSKMYLCWCLHTQEQALLSR